MKNIKYLFILVCLFGVVYVSDTQATLLEDSDYDLVVAAIDITPTRPAVGQLCRITVKIKNNGITNLYTSNGFSSFSYDFTDFTKESSTYPSPSLSNAIAPNEYAYFIFTGRFYSFGAKTLSFTIDSGDELDEDDETNNSATGNLTVFDSVDNDLAITEIDLSQDEPIVNTNLDISIKVSNIGLTGLTTAAGLERDDILPSFTGFVTESYTLPTYPTLDNPLDPNEYLTYTYNGYFNEIGSKNISFSINNRENIVENTLSNNASSTPILVYLDEAARDAFTISNITDSLISTSSVRINWMTDEDTTGHVQYKKIGEDSTLESTTTASGTSHEVTLKNLAKGQNYYYKIVGTGGSLTKDTPYYTFSTPLVDEISLSTDFNLITNNTNKTVSFSWATNLLSSGYVYYKKSGSTDYTSGGSDSLNLSHSVILTALENGDYSYYLKSISDGGLVYQPDIANFSITEASVTPPEVDTPATPATPVTAPDTSPEAISDAVTDIVITNNSLYNTLQGKIILKVEANGEAYYINPDSKEAHYLGRPDDAFSVMREQGIGISNSDLNKIPIGLSNLSGSDADNDGLPDIFEDAIGTDKNKKDTDNDGHDDKDELSRDYNPNGVNQLIFNNSFSTSQSGKIFLQVENNGEAWYISPSDKKRYFLGRPADAFNVMRNLGLGISNNNFDAL